MCYDSKTEILLGRKLYLSPIRNDCLNWLHSFLLPMFGMKGILRFFLLIFFWRDSALPLLLPTTALGSTETWDNINFGVKTVFLISSSSSSSAHSSSLEAGNYWGPPLFPPWTTMFMAPSLLIFLLWCSCRVNANSPQYLDSHIFCF